MAEKGGNEVGEGSKHVVISLVESGEVGGIREVSDHPAAEDTHRAELQLVRDRILPYEHILIEREGLRSMLVELLVETGRYAVGGTVSNTS